jgi:hypothetical protein
MKNLLLFILILAPQTPSNWKLGRQLGQGKFFQTISILKQIY